MARGSPSTTTAHALAHLTQAIFDLHSDQIRDLALFQQSLHLLAVIEDNRNERLDSANGSVPPILWFVLIAGAIITLGYPAFFGTTNLVAQILMTATLAAARCADAAAGAAPRFSFHRSSIGLVWRL